MIQWVALKKIKVNEQDFNEGLPHTFLREITVMVCLGKHDNIVKLLDLFWHEKSFIISMEYADKGDLYKHLNSSKGKLKFDQIRSILREILNGVEYLHSKGIIHRDLKTSNILINSSNGIKIADFGLSKHVRMPMVQMTQAI